MAKRMQVVQYDPYIYDAQGRQTFKLKPFRDDPRCLYGWKPANCTCYFGHGCVREVGHPGRCWDGLDAPAPPCSYAQRPKDWDSKQRKECNT